MRAVIAAVFYCALLAVATSSQSAGSEPSPMEAFASHQGVRTTWFNEVARWEQDGTRLVLTAVVLEDSARESRGMKVDLSSENARDQVYLDEQATERTRLALVEISDAVALTGMPGAFGCMGAKEFTDKYDWPWNKYHELNVDFCGDSKNRVLVLHGRGKPGSFRFPGKSPTVLAEILATAMQRLKQRYSTAGRHGGAQVQILSDSSSLDFQTPQFAQDSSTNPAVAEQARRRTAISLLRIVNTAEATYKDKNGSFGTWPNLLSSEPKFFEAFLARNTSNLHFTDAPEILPKWNLRLNVHVDGQGYDVLLSDMTDEKCGYAALTDESGAIRQSKAIDCDI